MALLSTHCQHREMLFPPLHTFCCECQWRRGSEPLMRAASRPKVRAWSPFTVQQKRAGVLRREGQGSPPNSSSFTGGVRKLSLRSPWLGKVQALMLHLGTRMDGKNPRRKTGSPPFQMPAVGWVNSKSRNLTNSPLWQLFLG